MADIQMADKKSRTPSKLSTHAIFAISGRPSNVVVLPSTPFAPEVTSEIITDKPTIEGTGRMRRHSTPAQILPPLDIEVYTPTIPNGDSISAAELPPAPVLRPAKLPSIGDETARRTSWRLSYASDRRASHLRSLSGQEHRKSRSFSQGQLPPLPIGDESDSVRPNPLVYDLPTVAPLRHWLHSQGLRIPSEVIDDSSSENESRSPSAKKLGKRKVLSHEKLYTDQENFGGVDGSREHSPVLHLHEMGISQRLGSRGLVTSTSSPALSVCGSRFDGGHRRGISGVSSAAGSKYSRYSNFSPYSERSRYFTQKSNRGSKHSRSHSEIITPYSAHSRHQEQPKEDSSKSGQYSSDQTGISSVNIPDAWGSPMRDIDGSSSIYHTPMEAKSSPFQVPSRTSSARNSPQKGAKYKIDQILHTGTSQHSGRRSDGSDRVDLGENDGADLDMVLSDGKKSEGKLKFGDLQTQNLPYQSLWLSLLLCKCEGEVRKSINFVLDSDFPIRSSGVDSGDFTNIVAIPLNSSTSVNKPNMRWMGIRSTFDISPEQAEMQSFNEREFSLRRISRHPTNNDSSLLASETQSFLEREKELMGIKKRFTMPVGKGDPKEPVRSKFKEEFEKPSLSFHRSLSRPHTFFSKIRFSKKKSNSKIEHQSLDGASMVDPADGAGDLTPGTPTPGIYVSTPGVYERSNPFDDASKAAEGSTTTPGLQTPDPRGPPRGPRAGGTPGGKAPKAAPVMAPAMRPGIEPSKGQKKKAMREKLASWEDELAAVEKAAREKSKGVAQPKRRRHRDDWDPVKWSSFPSHDREERAESAGAADRVDKQDFAIKARTPSGNVLEWHHSDRKHHFQHHEQPEHVNLTTRDKISLKLRNTLFKIQSTEAAFENDAANGRRTSISAGGELEFPELEIVGGTESSGDLEKMEAEIEEALRIEEELKANERKRQEAAAKRALMRAPPPTTDGSLDGVVQTWAGGESEMERERLVDNSVQVADPHFYDDCVDAPVVERDGEWFDDNEDADESSSIHSARTTGSVQLEMERGTAKEKGMITCIGSLDSKGGNKEKFGTWNGRGARGQKKNNSSAQTVYGFKTKKVVVGRGASGVERNGSSQNEGILRMSTVDFQRDAERSERVEMERVLSAAKAAWGV